MGAWREPDNPRAITYDRSIRLAAKMPASGSRGKDASRARRVSRRATEQSLASARESRVAPRLLLLHRGFRCVSNTRFSRGAGHPAKPPQFKSRFDSNGLRQSPRTAAKRADG